MIVHVMAAGTEFEIAGMAVLIVGVILVQFYFSAAVVKNYLPRSIRVDTRTRFAGCACRVTRNLEGEELI